jgi:putative acetyltransferase
MFRPRPSILGVYIRPATTADVDGIAAAHVDAIHTLGAAGYDAAVIADWGAPRTGERYAEAMRRGEHMFVAVEDAQIVGFAAHRVEAGQHRIAVYVRGRASRHSVGTMLYVAAESAARAAGAAEIHVDASLVAVDFYRSNGFTAIASAVHPLRSGRSMECVQMSKRLGD